MLSLLTFYTHKLEHKEIWNNWLENKLKLINVFKIYKAFIVQKLTRFATNNGAQHVCIKMIITKDIAEKYKHRGFVAVMTGRPSVAIKINENDVIVCEVHVGSGKVVSFYKLDENTKIPRYQHSFSMMKGMFFGEVKEMKIVSKLKNKFCITSKKIDIENFDTIKFKDFDKVNITERDVYKVFEKCIFLLDNIKEYDVAGAVSSASDTSFLSTIIANTWVYILKIFDQEYDLKQKNKIICSEQCAFALLPALIFQNKNIEYQKLKNISKQFSPKNLTDFLFKNNFATQEKTIFEFQGVDYNGEQIIKQY